MTQAGRGFDSRAVLELNLLTTAEGSLGLKFEVKCELSEPRYDLVFILRLACCQDVGRDSSTMVMLGVVSMSGEVRIMSHTRMTTYISTVKRC